MRKRIENFISGGSLAALFAVLSVCAFKLFWGPIFHFGLSLIPTTAQYAWVGKVIVFGLVAVAGGIELPLVLAFGVIYFTARAFGD